MSESIDEVDSYAFTEGRFLNERQSPVRLTPGDVDRGRSHRRIDGARAGVLIKAHTTNVSARPKMRAPTVARTAVDGVPASTPDNIAIIQILSIRDI